MKISITVLALLLLTPYTLAVACSEGTTKSSGCEDCATTAADSPCNWCQSAYYLKTTTSCTRCPTGYGRTSPGKVVTVETVSVCRACAPQLTCSACGDNPQSCTRCALGTYGEMGIKNGYAFYSCSTNCTTNNYTSQQLVPVNTATDASCKNCADAAPSCVKCEYSTTLKGVMTNTIASDTLSCTECADQYYLVQLDPAYTKACWRCGANCKKCTDRQTCTECLPGWSKATMVAGDCMMEMTSSNQSTNTTSSSGSVHLLQIYFLMLIFGCLNF
jgi:hypothetical protein